MHEHPRLFTPFLHEIAMQIRANEALWERDKHLFDPLRACPAYSRPTPPTAPALSASRTNATPEPLMRQACARLAQRFGWAASFEELMKDPLRNRLIRMAALHPQAVGTSPTVNTTSTTTSEATLCH